MSITYTLPGDARRHPWPPPGADTPAAQAQQLAALRLITGIQWYRGNLRSCPPRMPKLSGRDRLAQCIALLDTIDEQSTDAWAVDGVITPDATRTIAVLETLMLPTEAIAYVKGQWTLTNRISHHR